MTLHGSVGAKRGNQRSRGEIERVMRRLLTDHDLLMRSMRPENLVAVGVGLYQPCSVRMWK